MLVVLALYAAISSGWDNRRYATILDIYEQRVRVVGLICQNILSNNSAE